MITITLTGEEALEYIKLKTTPSFQIGSSINDCDNSDIMLFSDKADPKPVKTKVPDVRVPINTSFELHPTPVVAPELSLNITKQKRMQDEMEGKSNPFPPINPFPPTLVKVTPPPAPKKPDHVDKSTPFNWKPWEATIISIADESYPSRRTLQGIMNALPKGIVTRTVLRNKLVREGIAVAKDGALSWRKDGYDHKTRGFKSRMNK